jgi:hypothetical protein
MQPVNESQRKTQAFQVMKKNRVPFSIAVLVCVGIGFTIMANYQSDRARLIINAFVWFIGGTIVCNRCGSFASQVQA